MTDRYDWNRAHGSRDRIVHANHPLRENDRKAKNAENFLADRYGLPHNDRPGPRDAAFRKVTKLPGGREVVSTIGVRWTDLDYGKMLHAFDSTRWATAYVLVTGDPEEGRPFRIAGWAWGFQLRASVRDLGYGQTYALDQDELRLNVDMLFASLFGVMVGGG